MMAMFNAFYHGELDLFRINFASVTLVPKEENACTMKTSRPNCSYKIFTKVLTNRINRVADMMISSNQTTFIKGRYIIESVVTDLPLMKSCTRTPIVVRL